METIDDVRREEGNPNAGEPNTGPIALNRGFRNPGAGARLMATVVLILGALATVAGVVTFIIPLAIVGIGVLIGGAFLFGARTGATSENIVRQFTEFPAKLSDHFAGLNSTSFTHSF